MIARANVSLVALFAARAAELRRRVSRTNFGSTTSRPALYGPDRALVLSMDSAGSDTVRTRRSRSTLGWRGRLWVTAFVLGLSQPPPRRRRLWYGGGGVLFFSARPTRRSLAKSARRNPHG